MFRVRGVDKGSKAWVADPGNRVCDAPGSWYCAGQYPPKLRPLLTSRRDFAQLEDFNKKGQKGSEYTRLLERDGNAAGADAAMSGRLAAGRLGWAVGGAPGGGGAGGVAAGMWSAVQAEVAQE
eukprot:gene4-5871_t